MEDQAETPGRFKNVGFAAIWAAVLTLACVIIGQTAEQFADTMAAPNSVVASASDMKKGNAAAAVKPQFNAIDYATTGAIKGQTVIISPCTGEKTVQ